MTGRSFAIASSTRRTLLRRPTSIGMMAPGKSTEFRSGKMGSVSGISPVALPLLWPSSWRKPSDCDPQASSRPARNDGNFWRRAPTSNPARIRGRAPAPD